MIILGGPEMPLKYGWDICDDFGIWVVVSPHLGGSWLTEADAQAECNKRNFEDGTANQQGELKGVLQEADQEQFVRIHLVRPDCTCVYHRSKAIN